MPGLFDNVTSYNGQQTTISGAMQLAANDPVVLGVRAALNMLPEGGFKSWMTANPVQFWKKVITLITGRKYRTDEYRLGERYGDNIVPGNSADFYKSYKNVPDSVVEEAKKFFTLALGVRVDSDEDLWNLEKGVDAYYSRQGRDDIPMNAVKRAVMLVKNYFKPSSTFNTVKWDLSLFDQYPLVAPVPDLQYGKLWNGPLPGGAVAVNGLIPIDAAIKQVVRPADDETVITEDDVPVTVGGVAVGTKSTLYIVFGILLLIIIFVIYKKRH